MITFRDDVPQDDIETDGEEEEISLMNLQRQDENIEDLDESVLENELAAMRKRVLKTKKNIEKRNKIKAIKAMPKPGDLTEKATDIMDNMGDLSAFSLASIKSKDAFDKLARATGEEYDEHVDNESKEWADEERALRELRRHDMVEGDEDIEEELDQMYSQYLSKKTPRQKAKLQQARLKESQRKLDVFGAIQEERDEEEVEHTNPLLGKLKVSDSRREQQWYGQNIFNVLNEVDDELPAAKKKKKDLTQVDEDSEGDDGDYTDLRSQTKKKTDSQFEEVPKEMHDEETRANTLAIAGNLLRKKQRQEFIDNAYNRFAFNDKGPEWFEDDERRHNKASRPISKEDVRKMREKFKEINAIPMKKVLEAQFRKKRKMKEKLDKMKERANAVSDNPDLSNTEKAKELQKIYKLAQGDKARKRVYIRGNKQSSMLSSKKGSSIVKVVDTRMKKDIKREKDKNKRDGKRGQKRKK